MAPATMVYAQKFFVKHDYQDTEAVVEIKVWEVSDHKKYPDGLKYSLFCVNVESNEIIVGFDNHHPKGPHIHVDQVEQHYFFESIEKLIEDFYSLLKARGYTL